MSKAPLSKPLRAVNKKATVEEHLNAIITTSLGGPGGDPDECHRLAAAHAFLALEKLGYTPKDVERLRADLTFDDMYKVNFLEEAEDQAH